MTTQKLLAGFPRPQQNLTDRDPLPGCIASLKWKGFDNTVIHLTVDNKPHHLFYLLRVYDKRGDMIRGTPKIVLSRADELAVLATLEKYL